MTVTHEKVMNEVQGIIEHLEKFTTQLIGEIVLQNTEMVRTGARLTIVLPDEPTAVLLFSIVGADLRYRKDKKNVERQSTQPEG